MKEILMQLSLNHNGDWDKIYKSITSDKKVAINKEQIKEYENKVITIWDSDYPDSFKKMDKPPFVIYYEGNKKLLKNKNCLSFYFNEVTSIGDYKHIRNYINKLDFKEKEKALILNKRNFVEMVKIKKEFLAKNIILILDDSIKSYKNEEVYSNLIKNVSKDGLILSEFPSDKSQTQLQTKDRRNLRILSAVSSEIILPKLKKDQASYELMCHCIDDDTTTSTLPIEGETEYANNFLIKEGSKNILEN